MLETIVDMLAIVVPFSVYVKINVEILSETMALYIESNKKTFKRLFSYHIIYFCFELVV